MTVAIRRLRRSLLKRLWRGEKHRLWRYTTRSGREKKVLRIHLCLTEYARPLYSARTVEMSALPAHTTHNNRCIYVSIPHSYPSSGALW